MRSGIEDLIAQLSEINPALALNVPIHTPEKETKVKRETMSRSGRTQRARKNGL
jgi:hypothetical protein